MSASQRLQLPVGMQACDDVMIGHRGRSVHEAIPHICGAKAIPTSLLVFYHHLELNSQSIKTNG